MDNNIQLKQGTIKNLQEYVAEKIKERGFEDESLHERLVLLMELELNLNYRRYRIRVVSQT